MKKTKLLTSVLSVVLAVLLVALLVGNYFAMNYSTIITTYFGHTTTKTVGADESGASDYFTSDYDSDQELYNAGAALCEDVEAEGLVLLKNDNEALPLGSGQKVSLFSESSVDIIYGGTGSGSVDTSSAKTLKDVFEDVGYEVNPTLWDFYQGNHEQYARSNPSIFASRNNFAINEAPVSAYTDDVTASYDAYGDAAIVVISRSGGEGDDLTRQLDESEGGGTYLQLTINEKDMLQMIHDSGKFNKVIVLVNASNAMELGFIDDAAYGIDACLWIGAVGQTGLSSVAKAVEGTINPSGRLVDTYAYDSLSAPAMQNFGQNEYTNASDLDHLSEDYFGIMKQYTGKNYVVYQEGIYVGYRYYETRYEDTVLGTANVGDYDYNQAVQFPFGYGLSYTDFDFSNYVLNETDSTFEISVDVKNNGDTAGKEVVQVYMQSPYTEYDKANGIEKAAVELCGFGKTAMLEPGQIETVNISVDKEELKTYDAQNAKTYIVDAGDYYFTVADNAHDATNNILAAKGFTEENGMTATGDVDLTSMYVQGQLDNTTYAVDNGTPVTNQFDTTNIKYYYDDVDYLTRSDWSGSFPETIVLTATDQLKEDLGAEPDLDETGYTMPTTGKENGLSIISLRGKAYDDPQWEDLLDQLSVEDMIALVTLGGYQTSEIESVDYPGSVDQDGPAGISSTLVGGNTQCMAYPAEVVMAATFNTDLIHRVGELVGEDGIHGNVQGWYAPAMNTHRTPYSGRNFEYYSEDGYLAGMMGAAEVSGVQSKGVFCYIKHFAINDQETNRKGIATFSNEQAIREIYLTPFEYSVKLGNAHAVMTSHNRIGATWAAGYAPVLNTVLRDEWGFRGHIVSDYVGTPVYQSALEAVLAGNDLMLSTSADNEDISPYKDNAKVVTALRQGSKNILYTGVNSVAMNGLNESSEIVKVLPLWQYWLIAFDIVVVLLVLVGFYFIRKNYRKKMNIQ